MRKIFKYPLEITDTQLVKTPGIEQVLCVQVQNGKPTLWIVVNDNDAERPKELVVDCYGTGNPIPEKSWLEEYLDTVLLNGFVWHFFARSE